MIGPKTSNGVSLDKDVALGQQLDGLEGGAVRADQPLAAFHETLFVLDEISCTEKGCYKLSIKYKTTE